MRLLVIVFYALGCLCAAECRSILSDSGVSEMGLGEVVKRDSVNNDLEKRQHWSYGFAPGGKRDVEVPGEQMKRQHWSYGFAPGGKRAFVSGEDIANVDKKQHWSYGFAPGGKRDLESRENDLDKRQHWSYGFAPGGKREFESESPDESMQEKRQHWSYGFAPGGKRDLEQRMAMIETPNALDKRQHWSYGFAPGGKRNFADEDQMANVEDKRQHWSYGFAPGGKRNFEPAASESDDIRARENFERSIQALREILSSEKQE